VVALVACNDRPRAPEALAPAPIAVTADAAAPPSQRKPPPRTTKPHSRGELEALAKLELAGFTKTVRQLDASFLDVVQSTPELAVTVTIQPCLACRPLAIDRWRADKEALMVTLPPELRDRPDTTFEVGEAGPLIYVYQLGYATGELGTAFANAYILYHHDGVNQIRVIAAALEERPSRDELARAVPRERLEQAATTVLDAYVQAWRN
jgi:hypothetical protein